MNPLASEKKHIRMVTTRNGCERARGVLQTVSRAARGQKISQNSLPESSEASKKYKSALDFATSPDVGQSVCLLTKSDLVTKLNGFFVFFRGL